MLQISENEILQAFDLNEISESDLIFAYQNNLITEETMDYLIEGGIFDDLLFEEESEEDEEIVVDDFLTDENLEEGKLTRGLRNIGSSLSNIPSKIQDISLKHTMNQSFKNQNNLPGVLNSIGKLHRNERIRTLKNYVSTKKNYQDAKKSGSFIPTIDYKSKLKKLRNNIKFNDQVRDSRFKKLFSYNR